jgi:hypothetical protein
MVHQRRARLVADRARLWRPLLRLKAGFFRLGFVLGPLLAFASFPAVAQESLALEVGSRAAAAATSPTVGWRSA